MWSVENSRTKSHNGAHGSNDAKLIAACARIDL